MRGTVFLLLLLLIAAPAWAGDRERPPITVSGRVVDEQGRPLAGVRVYAPLYEADKDDETDAQGRFAIRPQHAKRVPIHVWANGYLETRTEIPRGTHGVTVVLERGASVRGRLSVPDGETLPKSVRILTRLSHGWGQTAAVGDDGRFEVAGFKPGEAKRLGVRAASYMPVLLTGRVFDMGKALDLGTVALQTGRSVTVHVRDHEDQPVAGARVRVQSTAWTPFAWGDETDATGAVRVNAATFDRLRVDVRGPHTDSATWVSFVEAGHKAASARVTVEHSVTLRLVLAWTGDGPAPWAGKDGVAVSIEAGSVPVDQRTRMPRYWRGRTRGNGSAEVLVARCVPGTWKDAQIRVDVRGRWTAVRRTLSIPRVEKPGGRVDLGTIEVGPPPAK